MEQQGTSVAAWRLPTGWKQYLRPLLIGVLVVAAGLFMAGMTMGFLTLSVAAVGIAFGACIVGGYVDEWTWTGIGQYRYTKSEQEEIRPPKTLWDLLQLLIIPAVLSLGAIWFSSQQQSQQALKVQQAQATAQVTQAHAQATARETDAEDGILNSYVDYVTDLLLRDQLASRDPREPARLAAQARTIAAMRRLDAPRNVILTRFLADAHLLSTVSFANTDLSGLQLDGAILTNARLQHADLTGTHLDDAQLDGAILDGATLSDTALQHAHLSNARLCDAVLNHADLRSAHLEEASLTGASIVGDTDLRGTFLGDADLENVTWRAVIVGGKRGTECPDHQTVGAHSARPNPCARHQVSTRSACPAVPVPTPPPPVQPKVARSPERG